MKNFIKKLKTIWWAVKFFVVRIQYRNPSKKLKIVGVTGTNGKTTTATLLYKITIALGYKAGLIGTVENLINGEKINIKNKNQIPGTTPDSITLTKIFNQMVKAGCEYVFMEVSSHALDQNRVWGVNFIGGIFTNLTHDHLDYHKNFENYFNAKKKFFKMLPQNAFALSNFDDEYGEKILDNIKAKTYFYSFSPDVQRLESQTSNVWNYGKILKLDFTGLDLDFNGEKINSKLLGKFNAYNLLSVWSACKLLGFDKEKVSKILENVEPPKGRFEHFLSKNGVLVIVDYAHTPDALEKVLSTAQEIKEESASSADAPKRRIISVFGCGGDRDSSKRPKMGKIGARLSDIAIFTSDNPRSEDPEKIIFEMQKDLNEEEKKKVITIIDRRLSIGESMELAKMGDIILCAGKGHENYQEIKGVKTHFNDMEEYRLITN